MRNSLRDASTVCLIRDTESGPEVLMVQRTPSARFMGSAWVFPGGAVDEDDGAELSGSAIVSKDSDLTPWRVAALRELVEETGFWLLESGTTVTADRPSGRDVFSDIVERGERFSGDALWYFANWITPAPLPIRFDTRFFAVVVRPGLDPSIDGNELVDALWIRPGEVLDRADAGRWLVAFPTRKVVEFLGAFDSCDGLRRRLEDRLPIEPIQPRLSIANGGIEILIPGEAGFDEAATGERDPELMAKMMQIVAAGGDVPPEFRST
ncbi:MAG: NUDIX hydrolase [Actinomycetota bacterium]|nr:NUDIX hydrolase [Actinomycetota bacterium]